MLYTEEYVRDKYTKYNNELFGGQLPSFDELEFHITMKRNPWGRGGVTQMFYYDSNGRITEGYASSCGYEKAYLELSNYYDNTEEWKDNVLVHEMVHIYEFTCEPRYILEAHNSEGRNTNFPKNGHGLIFYREADRLKQYGWDITRFVTQDGVKSASLSNETREKLSKRANTMMFMFGSYSGKTKGYPYAYRLFKTKKALDEFMEIRDDFPTIVRDAKFYYDLDADFINKFIRAKPKKGTFLLTKTNYSETLSNCPFVTLDEILGNVSKEKEDNEKQRLVVKELVITHLDELAEAILPHVELKYIEDSDESIILPFSMKYNIDNTTIKVAFNKARINSFEKNTIFINDYYSSRDYGIAYDVDLMDYIGNGQEYEEHKTQAIYEIKKLLRYALSISHDDMERSKNLVKLFRVKLKDSVFELKNLTKDEIREKLRKRFPKWSDEAIERTLSNPQCYVTENKKTDMKANELRLDKVLKEVFNNFINEDEINGVDDNEIELDPNFPNTICDN